MFKKLSKDKSNLCCVAIVIATAAVLVSVFALFTDKLQTSPEVSFETKFLYMQTAHSGSLSAEKSDGKRVLTLKNVSPVTVYFSERPNRETGHQSTEEFVAEWSYGEDSFGDNPPNAALDVISKDSQNIIILELMSVKYDAETKTLEYEVIILDDETNGAIPETFDEAALFIDSTHRDYRCDCSPSDGEDECTCKYKYKLGKSATKEFRGYCEGDAQQAHKYMGVDGISVTGKKKSTSCTVKVFWEGYVARSCTNWSPLSSDELNVIVHCVKKNREHEHLGNY